MKAITPIILLILSIAIFFWFIDPTYASIGTLRANLNDYHSALLQAQQASAKRDDLVNKYNSFSTDDLNRLQTLLPDSVDNIRLIVDLNSLAAKYNSNIQNITISSSNGSANSGAAVAIAQNNSVYGTLTLNFTTVMTYSQFVSFLKDMEQSLRLTDVSAVNFKSSDTNQTYSYNVTVNTYWLQ